MVDIALIQGTISSINIAKDIAKSLIGLNISSEVNGQLAEFQNVLFSALSSAVEAKSAQFSMLEKIRALEEEIGSIKTWKSEKQRYSLANPWKGTLVYALKKSHSSCEPAHWLYTGCYEQGVKGILNSQEKGGNLVMVCVCCKTQFSTPWQSGSVEFEFHEDIQTQ